MDIDVSFWIYLAWFFTLLLPLQRLQLKDEATRLPTAWLRHW